MSEPRDQKPASVPSPLGQLVLARWRGFYREPGVLFWTFGFPILLSIALGIAFRNRPPEPVAVAIARTAGSDETLAALAKDPGVKAEVLDEADAKSALRIAKVDLLVEPGDPPVYRYDPTRPEGRMARLVVDDALQRANGRVDAIAAREEQVTARGSRYIDFLVPGLVGMGLMSSGLWGIGSVIVEMRTRKLIKRLVATPMKKRDFLLGFVLMRAIFLLAELPVVLGFAALFFDVPVRGSVLLLAGVATLGSLAFAGIGLLLAARAQNSQTAQGLINLVSMPMFIVSGTFFSASRFPAAIQPVVKALPLTALNDGLRAVMLDGATAGGIRLEIGILAAWGLVSFVLALKLFRWG